MTVHPWIKDYIQLALRIDQAFQRLEAGSLVDHFYGPDELLVEVQGEPHRPIEDLIRDALALQDSVSGQNFEPARASFLEKQVRAMEAFCRVIVGQKFSLEEEIRLCLDIRPRWWPEVELERSLARLDQALPGSGDLRSRLATVMRGALIPADRSQGAVTWMQRILDEARRRTQDLVDLPDDERIEVNPIHGKPYGAANWYLGGYRSRIELNVDRPVNLVALHYQMCHEGYPGHHTEFVLKERNLYRDLGYTEQSVYIIGPQLVISEGIASLAQEIIFRPDEIAGWVLEHLDPGSRREFGDLDLPSFLRALAGSMLDDLGGNLVTMIRQGHTEEDLVDYAMAYSPHGEGQIRQLLRQLESPLQQVYAFSYAEGKRLLQPLLAGPGRTRKFARFLTEQFTPSMVAAVGEEGF